MSNAGTPEGIAETARKEGGAAAERRSPDGARLTDEMFRSAFEFAPNGMCLVSPAGHFMKVNSAFCGMLGYAESELLGMTFLDVTHRDDRAASKEWVRRIVAGEENSETLEKRYIRKTGEAVWGIVHSSLLRNGAGAPLFFITHVQDISGRKRAEETLRESHERFQSVMDSLDSVVYVADMSTFEILYLNRRGREIWGDSVGRTCWKVFQAGQAGPCPYCTNDRLVGPAGEPGDPVVWELQNTANDRWYECRDRAIRWTDGRLVRMELATDITDRKMLEEQLGQARKMEAVGRLAGGIAHDFNNLLSVIIGYGDLILNRLGEGDPIGRDITEIRKAAERAAELTRQLLAYSRKQILQPQVVSLNRIVGGMDALLRRIIGENIDLVTRLEEDLDPVMVDPGQFEQIIVNLAVNARDAMPDGGRLTIETKEVNLSGRFSAEHPPLAPGRHALLTVSDTGVGMDAGTASRIFEPFFTTKDTGKGTGLGLSTVHGIVNQSRGYISVDSTPGWGTIFRIYLPILAEKETWTGDLPRETAAGGDETILLVEDEEAVREVCCEILSLKGYRVLTAENGEEALVRFRDSGEPIRLLVTDVVMTGMNGIDLADRIVATDPGIEVLFMSGYTPGSLESRNIPKEGTHFIQKPFSPAAFAKKVRDILDGLSPEKP